MWVRCPHGWTGIERRGTITIHYNKVNICGDICDSADMCGIAKCEYFDLSREANRRFCQAQCDERSFKGQAELPEKKRAFQEKHGYPTH
jgi:hypothetical protein